MFKLYPSSTLRRLSTTSNLIIIISTRVIFREVPQAFRNHRYHQNRHYHCSSKISVSKPALSFVPSVRALQLRVNGVIENQPERSTLSDLTHRRNYPRIDSLSSEDAHQGLNQRYSSSKLDSNLRRRGLIESFEWTDPYFPAHSILKDQRHQGKPHDDPRPLELYDCRTNRSGSGAYGYSRSSGRRDENLIIRCTEIDSRGKILGIRSMTKSEICSKNRLQLRDLRKIDSRIANVVPSILVREETIIFNVLSIRALIRADTVMIFDHPSNPPILTPRPISQKQKIDQISLSDKSGGDEDEEDSKRFNESKYFIRSTFLYNLLNSLHIDRHQTRGAGLLPGDENLPFEFKVLESMLSCVMSSLEGELNLLKSLVSNVLDGLDQSIDREKLKQLLLYSKKISSFNSRVTLVQECLDEILDNDQDMANAYLSQKLYNDNVPKRIDDHEELEQLLESNSNFVEEILHETNIKSTEEIIELILDSNRNKLLALDLKVSMTTMGISSGALIAGLFGMNLRTNLEQQEYAFFIVSGLSIGTILLMVTTNWRRLRSMRRIGLKSLSSSSSSSSISSLNSENQFLNSSERTSIDVLRKGKGPRMDLEGFEDEDSRRYNDGQSWLRKIFFGRRVLKNFRDDRSM